METKETSQKFYGSGPLRWAGMGMLALALMLVGQLALPSRAHAQADVPFYANTEVEPNVLFVLDTSGSMAWSFQVMDGAMRTRLEAAKKILTGEYGHGGGGGGSTGPNCPDGTSVVSGKCARSVHQHCGCGGGYYCAPPPYNDCNWWLDNRGNTSNCPDSFSPNDPVMVHGYCHDPWPQSSTFRRGGNRYAEVPELPPPPPTAQVSIIDAFGSLINFAFSTYSGSYSSSSTSAAIHFPNGQGTTTFSNDDNPGLKATILSQSASGNTPTTQAMRDAGCWIMGEDNMNDALLRVATSPDPDIPFPNGGEQVTTVIYQNICPNSMNNPSIVPCPGNAGCDPAFGCRRTFIILITDGEETSGWPGSYNQPRGRKTIASALRRSTYLTGGEGGIPTYVALMAPCNINSNDNDGNGIPDDCQANNNNLVEEGDTWARYGGTDATPDPDDCTKPNNDGGESFLGTSAEALSDGLRRALACVLEGSHTRAQPTFVATSTNFAKNSEIDGYFSIQPGERWWRGELQAFSFEQINAGDLETPLWDAGKQLNARTASNPRNLYVTTREPWNPEPVSLGDATLGATAPSLDPPPVTSSQVREFKPTASSALADIVGVTTSRMSQLITFLRDEDGPANTLTFSDGSPKPWSLGPIVNSSPIIVNPPVFDFRVGAGTTYADFVRAHAEDPTMIYVGAQDGFMHGFVLSDEAKKTGLNPGGELWGFMPYEAILRMPAMDAGVIFTVDGTPSASVVRFHNDPSSDVDDSFHTVLVFSLRGGGFSTIALDITDPTTPRLLWQNTHIAMGRTFSKPNIAEYGIEWDGGQLMRRWMVAMGAGFNPTRPDGDPIVVNPIECADIIDGLCIDESGDPYEPPEPADPDDFDPGLPGVGNWVLFWDLETGRLVQNVPISDDPAINRYNSVAGDLLALDRDLNGTVDNLIFGDLEGRLWKILTYKTNPEDWWTDSIPAADPQLGLDPGKSPCVMFDQGSLAADLGISEAEARRPIFYAPAATFDCNGFVNLVWGTGDLTDPNDTQSRDFLFAINDPDGSSCGESSPDAAARDFTCDEIEDDQLKQDIEDAFPFVMEPGEKILSSPLIVNGRFFVSTFQPQGSGCSIGRGRVISGPAICCRLQPEPGANSFEVLNVSEWGDAAPPLIIGPDGQPTSVRAVQDTGAPQAQFLELERDRRILHWQNIFGVGGIKPCASPTAACN
ncbi:MAG: hypothetical protein KDH09_11930 [Chrysiogenetes bacterium]|nr:hypothetical protein [Chrysiogenetes bacterium]